MRTSFDPEAAKKEYERLFKWREAWTRLANDRTRMRRLGGLQKTQDKVERRGALCNQKIAALLREFDAHHKDPSKVKTKATPIAKMTLNELRIYYADATRDQLLLCIQSREQALEQRELAARGARQ